MSQISERLLVQAHLDAKQPTPLTAEQEAALRGEIAAELKKQNAVLVAHYYCDPVIQALAEETGGCVSDSLEMARFGSQSSAQTVLVAGVKFMGETAKILNPEKRILMPTLEAWFHENANLMDPQSWHKLPEPVLQSCFEHKVYGPGHNSFTVSADGKTDLLVYHARTYTEIVGDPLWDPNRHTYVKALRWDDQGMPLFGRPSLQE